MGFGDFTMIPIWGGGPIRPGPQGASYMKQYEIQGVLYTSFMYGWKTPYLCPNRAMYFLNIK
jgi:hypothetical protein